MIAKDPWLLDLALKLNRATTQGGRFGHLLESLVQVIPCDAACLFAIDGELLRPLSIHGLVPETLYRTFPLQQHPRLAQVAQSRVPVIFPLRSPLPDPFDGLIQFDDSASLRVHSCMGYPLIFEGDVIGVLTADALEPGRFDQFDHTALEMVAALAASTLRTSMLMEKLESMSREQKMINQTIVHEASRETPLLGVSPAMEVVRRAIEVVAPTDLAILITGETGTGKEVVARQIHIKSKRQNEALIYVNCAALPESIAESELFGHKRGAFTGAHVDRTGKLEMAHKGTVFLDEIGELPLSLQPKLLRFLQEGEIQKVGSDQLKKVDVRVLAATNRDLQKEIRGDRFRSDLFHRLNAYPIPLPPLREREKDALILASYFCDRFQKKFGTLPIRMHESLRTKILETYWPGNVRELKNALSRAVLLAQHHNTNETALVLRGQDLELSGESFVAPTKVETNPVFTSQKPLLPLRDAVEHFQRQYIMEAWVRNQQNWSRTADALGMHRSNLHHVAKRLDLLPQTVAKGDRPTQTDSASFP